MASARRLGGPLEDPEGCPYCHGWEVRDRAVGVLARGPLAVARGAAHDTFFTAEQPAADLEPRRWEVLVAEARPRPATDPQGRTITIHDAVLRARRKS